MAQDTKWRDLPNFSDYIVSECGQLAKRIKPQPNVKGYLRFQPMVNGKLKVLFVHRAVALSWIPNPKNKATINHRNMIVDDNRVVNLEWMTNDENRRHRAKGPTPVIDDSNDPEIWRSVPTYDNYIASNKGNVAKIMQLKPHDRGFLKIKIQVDGIRKDYYIQRLVAETWIKPIMEDELVIHINRDHRDNRVSNLLVVTKKEHIQNLFAKGVMKQGDRRGVKNGNNKITNADVIEIRRRYDQGESPIKIAEDYPVGDSMICFIGLRKHWTHI